MNSELEMTTDTGQVQQPLFSVISNLLLAWEDAISVVVSVPQEGFLIASTV